MLTDKDLRELLNYQPESPILSVYLNTDPVEGTADAHKLRLRSMLKDVDLKEDEAAVIRYFDHEHDWSGRSVAVFSCQEDGFFKSYSMAVPVRSRVRVANQPYVKPLADLLDSFGGYGVVLVDKQGARLFHFHLGELREEQGMMGESVRRTKHGGGSQAQGRRGGTAGQTDYTDELAERNIKDAVEFATDFFARKNIRRILVGGTEDNVSVFRNQLPKAWQSLVVGSFPISMVASENEVLERAMEVGHKAELRREERLVETLITNAEKGRGGVLSLKDTLGAIHEGRVHTLVIRDGYRAPGFRCSSCGFLTAEEVDACPFCGGEFVKIPDAVDEAVRQVMNTGGEVEVIHAGQAPLNFKNIGAILRY